MLFPVAVLSNPDGTLRALAPDLPGCDLTGRTEAELLPRLRLALEAAVTERLLLGQALPDTRDGAPPPPGTRAGTAGARWLTIHLNVGHLVALAAHQRARTGGNTSQGPA